MVKRNKPGDFITFTFDQIAVVPTVSQSQHMNLQQRLPAVKRAESRWAGSSPWTARPGVLPSVLSEVVSGQERRHNGLSYCPSLRKLTLDTWNLECCPAETVCKNTLKEKKKKARKIRKTERSELWHWTVNWLTRAVRSCSCSYPAHSPPSSSQSGSGAAPTGALTGDTKL